MGQQFNTIGLIGKFGDPSVGDTVLAVSQFLVEQGRQVLLDEDTAKNVPNHKLETANRQELGERCDLVIIVGGDGTLLNAVRSLTQYDIPLLGINLGHLGFLVDISPDDMLACLTQILKGEYQEEQRLLLHTTIYHEGELVSSSDAFNDVVIHKWEVARMIEIETYINGHLLTTMRADGLIVSTPTGSTAYALSGGGPILQPDINAIVIVPICPHTMSYRPIVVDGDSKIEVVVTPHLHAHAQVTCDGQINLGVVSGDKVVIQKNKHGVRLIHPPQHDHYDILRAKLHWGERL